MLPAVLESQFESQRGVSRVEVRHGFAQVHVPLGSENLTLRRIEVLRILAEAGVSHKYLKLTLDGLAFIISGEQVERARGALEAHGIGYELNPDRSVILVHAIGMREEAGMIASILQAAIASGVHIDHIGDMHDKMFMVVEDHQAQEAAERLRSQIWPAGRLESSLEATPARPKTNGHSGLGLSGSPQAKIKVLKFGGTSVADQAAREAAAQRVADARDQGFTPIAVVSAIGRRGAPYATDTLIGELQEVDPDIVPSQRDLDLIMACGEIISAAIFAQTLRSVGVNALAITGRQAGIKTDGIYGNARITRVDPARILAHLAKGITPVICGFQGAAEHDDEEITTLGRGGTDTTAAAIGAAVNATAVEIYTDVDGIKTADPDSVPNAPTLSKASYDEVAELAHQGAKVLHPRAAEIAMRYGIPLWVKNSFTVDYGTEIVAEDVSYTRPVTGITHTGRLLYLQFDLASVSCEDRPKIEERLFGVLSRFGISLYMLNLSPIGVGFAVDQVQYAQVERLLDGLVVPIGVKSTYILQLGAVASAEALAQMSLLDGAKTLIAERTEGCTMVSVIGRTYFGKPGVFFRILEILNEGLIQVFQTGDSDFSVSFLLPEVETNRAVRMLHESLVPQEV